LAYYERELRECCNRMDSLLQIKTDHPHANYKRDVFSVQQNLSSQLAPWRIFLNHIKDIRTSHKHCNEVLESLYGLNDVDVIRMLEVY
jgi:hypothetical protein